MASNRRRLQWNTRERLLSTDLNDATALLHANLSDDVAALASGDRFKSSLPLSGVVAGGVTAANGLDLVVSVTPFVAFKFGSPATGLDSPYLRLETVAVTSVDLSAFVDPGNDRWVAIEVAPGTAQELVSARDLFQPAIGTFTPANVDKIIRSEPVFTVNAGVPAVAPQLPLGNPDVVPLAYVYLPAATASIAVTDVILCRPRFTTSSLEATNVIGRGGLDVPAAGTTLVIARPYGIKFDGLGFPIQVDLPLPADADLAGNPNWVNGEAYPLGDAPVYAYIAAAPYPPGYDNDVSGNREYVDISNRIPSSQSNPVRNGLIIWSTQSPLFLGNAISAHPNVNVLLNDSTWNGGTSELHSYLGAASAHVTNGPVGLATQFTDGDRVRITETAKLGEDQSTQSASSLLGAPGVFNSLSPLLLNALGKGFAIVLPDALEYDVLCDDDESGAGVSYFMQLNGSGEPLTGPPNRGTFFVSNDGGLVFVNRQQHQVRTNIIGAFTFSHSEFGGSVSIFRIVVVGYRDRVLALR